MRFIKKDHAQVNIIILFMDVYDRLLIIGNLELHEIVRGKLDPCRKLLFYIVSICLSQFCAFLKC